MKVQFLMPHYTDVPIGGYRTVYELSNGLVARGHEATVVLPRTWVPRTGFLNELKNAAWPRRTQKREPNFPTWIKLDPRVRLKLVADPREKWLDGADATFATLYSTAPVVHDYSKAQGTKLYLIQHDESFAAPREEVYGTYRLPMHKVVVAKWLKELVASVDGPDRVDYVPNAVDHGQFRVTRPFAERPQRVGMLYSGDPTKAAWDGVNALERVREKLPIEAVLFGTAPRHHFLPEWIDYHQLPKPDELTELYNGCQVFLHTSWSEGWGLPPAEAMACGCGVVAAENGGVLDYLRPGETAYLGPSRDPVALAHTLLSALEDPQLANVAEAGRRSIEEYRWERSTDMLLAVLKKVLGD
jgi:glycosyltransferase involved in cell wall biosynthesis